jgi:hypothetical protein
VAVDADEPDEDRTPPPAVLRQRAPLTAAERRTAAAVAVAPVLLAAVVLAPFAVWGPATAGDVVSAALVYGGLLGLAAGFVYVDRVHGRQCPRCGRRGHRGEAACPVCGYDLAHRPRYACEERHATYLEPGLCECGRRLHEQPVARGVGREVAVVLRIGGWLLAFLLGIGLLLQLTGPAGG